MSGSGFRFIRASGYWIRSGRIGGCRNLDSRPVAVPGLCGSLVHVCQSSVPGVLQGLRNLIKAYLFGRKGIGTIREQY